MLTFHEAVSHLLEGQDQLIEDHRTVVQVKTDRLSHLSVLNTTIFQIQDSRDLIVEEEQLLELVNDVDGNYDIESRKKKSNSVWNRGHNVSCQITSMLWTKSQRRKRRTLVG